MKHATSLALHLYWQKRQRNEGVRAGAIYAGELAPILNSVFLLAANSGRDPTFTFCGADIAARYGRDLCPEPFLDLWTGTDRDIIAGHIVSLSTERKGLVAGMIAETIGGGFTCFELLLLPLSAGSGSAGLLCSMARVGGHEETNRVRAQIVAQSLRSARFLASATHEAPTSNPTRFGWKGPGGELPRRYGHLTVLSGGREFGQPDPRSPLTQP
jgi:hypothetical protein